MALTIIETLTDGTQRTQITDGTDNVSISTVGGQKALNTAILSNVPVTGPSTSTLTSVASSITSVSLLAANVNRKGASFYNDSTKNAFIALASTASTTLFTIFVPAGSFYELTSPSYTGAVSAIWSTAQGFMRVTELLQ